MKILFAIQGTGNGHLTRARDIYPELIKYGDVDVLISGIQSDLDFPFPVKYRCYGLSFIFGHHGGVDIRSTIARANIFRLIRDIRNLKLYNYDLIINDFEPISAWACKVKKKQCIGLSHQSAVLDPRAPQPLKSDWLGKLVLRHYAPVDHAFGFHFKNFGKDVFTPVIRKEVRTQETGDLGHYTVYLPAYDDQTILEHLSYFKDITWEVFSKHNDKPFIYKNVKIMPVENNSFIKSMATSSGVLCGAGFEAPAEALYLGKKLLVIPMQTQYEQQCNAVVLSRMGVTVIKYLGRKYYNKINWWLLTATPISVHYPDQTKEIVSGLMEKFAPLAVAPQAPTSL